MADQAAVQLRNSPHRSDFFHWSAQSQMRDTPTIVGAEGVYFWDREGKKYLDFCAQLVNVSLGHQHPRIVDAIKEQAEKLCFIAPFFSSEPREQLADMLAEIAPGDLNTTLFGNTGTEANEYALTIAKQVTGRVTARITAPAPGLSTWPATPGGSRAGTTFPGRCGSSTPTATAAASD